MKIQLIEPAGAFFNKQSLRVHPEVIDNAHSLIGSHLNFLKEFYDSKGIADPNRHLCLIAIDKKAEEVISYRYFYFEPGKKYCELFAVFVASEYRCRGIATQLFHQALAIASDAGCTHFTIRFGRKTRERDGLVEAYKRFAMKNSDSIHFRIYYGTKIFDY